MTSPPGSFWSSFIEVRKTAENAASDGSFALSIMHREHHGTDIQFEAIGGKALAT